MKLTNDQNYYLQGLLEQEISQLNKYETFKGEYKEEIELSNDILLILNKNLNN